MEPKPNLPESAKKYIDRYRNEKGIVDFYNFLGVARDACEDELLNAMTSKLSNLDVPASELLYQGHMVNLAAKHLSTKSARAAYDKTLMTRSERLSRRADTRMKRIALVAAPFFGVATVFRYVYDDDRGDVPTTLFALLLMATVFCLLVALTRLGDWLNKD